MSSAALLLATSPTPAASASTWPVALGPLAGTLWSVSAQADGGFWTLAAPYGVNAGQVALRWSGGGWSQNTVPASVNGRLAVAKAISASSATDGWVDGGQPAG
jgi:hypothetical protein